MELLQLRYFRTVAKLEHMTKAAQILQIAQPALSKTIARLEEHVGVPLFDRKGGRIRLNSFGRTFLDKVEPALILLEEAQKEVSDLKGLEKGGVHLATSSLSNLSKPLEKFLSLYPEVNMQITQASPEEIVGLVESGEVDIGFTAMPVEHPDIAHVTLLKEDVYLAVHQKHHLANRQSIRLSDAIDEPFIGYKEGFIVQKMNNLFFQQAGMSPKYVCRVDEPSAILDLVRTGLGVALFGCDGEDDPQITYLSIEYPICQHDHQLIWSEKRYFSLATKKFRNFIVQFFNQ